MTDERELREKVIRQLPAIVLRVPRKDLEECADRAIALCREHYEGEIVRLGRKVDEAYTRGWQGAYQKCWSDDKDVIARLQRERDEAHKRGWNAAIEVAIKVGLNAHNLIRKSEHDGAELACDAIRALRKEESDD